MLLPRAEGQPWGERGSLGVGRLVDWQGWYASGSKRDASSVLVIWHVATFSLPLRTLLPTLELLSPI